MALIHPEGYPPHLWIEPHREVIYRMVWGSGTSLRVSIDDKLIAAARELVEQGWIRQDGGSFTTAGLTYYRFVPTERLKIKDIKHAF